MTDDRDHLLLAVLPHVPFDGWGSTALLAGARDLGLDPAEAAALFPGGARDLVATFADWADRQLLEQMAGEELASLRVRERVSVAARRHFEILRPHREAVRRGLAFLALPQHAALGLKLLHRSSDAIWIAVGDSSTDHNWYSKRLLLAGVLSATTLYWLEDRSDEQAATWDFLDRRLHEVVRVGARVGQGVKRLISLPDRILQRGGKRLRSRHFH